MSQRQQQRAMRSGVVNSNLAVPGSILWLPLKATVKTSHLKRRKNDGAYAEYLSKLASIPNGAFNHPIVVIARSADTVDFHLFKRKIPRAERAVPTPLAAPSYTHPPRANPIAASNRIKPSENSSTLASCLTPATTDNRIRTSQICSSLAKSLKPATPSNRTQTSPTPMVPAPHHWYSGMNQVTWNTTNDVVEGVIATDLTFRF
ncbi:hypothetical protein LTR16_001500 [Cryomyces antarcticus]|uniref:Uncharacterized protein n=1 Tax=Cryomyces antarcticus TaxID=329879 RepID=A0ABR0LRS6_9PEZI|nr:hypothetical protein LTR39_000970 [Cryomyces antarcticus]KAK5020183.1 hypothetical protein LTR60_000756 [Cryomyces antarcticus]KAK5201779.1 hypothetical protein LTR16_001500 [Cryomyces antarcticus]